eukprot:gnl/Chilomastix_caulleri/2068.p2 GENE.gnl/Chilomastix_caulleri/2068~~gnl/Chilomastix_caulleri/2068.p2  ORF type:complete len:88 (+),score=35.88 gnl/Chilomastix_caulleri/2068:263-526(+)
MMGNNINGGTGEMRIGSNPTGISTGISGTTTPLTGMVGASSGDGGRRIQRGSPYISGTSGDSGAVKRPRKTGYGTGLYGVNDGGYRF